jgi:hypothetical protein
MRFEQVSRPYPNLNLKIGTADVLLFDDGFTDVIWYEFCLYLVDRVFLHRVDAEADRVLRNIRNGLSRRHGGTLAPLGSPIAHIG